MTNTTRHPSSRRADAGSAAVSIAIVFPAIAILFLACAQAAMVAAAHHVALAAAEDGLRVARAHYGTLTAGRAAATAFAQHEPVLTAPTVQVSGTTRITVTVRGHAPALLPGLHWPVAGTARGVREQFTTPTGARP